MVKMKQNSKRNKTIEEAVNDIRKLEKKYSEKIIYKAARRYNDRIYSLRRKKCLKKKK